MTALRSVPDTRKLDYPLPSTPKMPNRKLGKLTLPSLCIMVAGTGGVFANENVAQLAGWISTPTIDVRRAQQPRIADTRSVKEHLLNVRNTFGLNMSDLARVFGVTRPTAYSWLDNNVEPKAEAQALIVSLSHAADRLVKIEGGRPELYARRPMFDGKSLVDLLKEGQSIKEALVSIEALAKKESTARKSASTRYAGKPKRRLENLDAMATPLVQEPV